MRYNNIHGCRISFFDSLQSEDFPSYLRSTRGAETFDNIVKRISFDSIKWNSFFYVGRIQIRTGVHRCSRIKHCSPLLNQSYQVHYFPRCKYLVGLSFRGYKNATLYAITGTMVPGFRATE